MSQASDAERDGGGPRLMFVPVSGPEGAGEYYESRAVAAGALARWPAARVSFVLSRQARYAASVEYPATLVDGSPTRANAEVASAILRERPDAVIFASSGRVAQFAVARRAGARVVAMSPRPSARRRSFRLRRMRFIDQHWISEPSFARTVPTRLERLKLALFPRLEVVFLDGVHDPIDEEAVAQRKRELGLDETGYAVFAPGGGGTFGGVSAVPAFLTAARQVAGGSDERVLLVAGPNAELDAAACSDSRLRVVRSLPNGELMGLVRDAALAVTTGGTLMVQALMQRTPCVAAAISSDQPARIAACSRQGLVVPADLDATALTSAALDLLGRPDRREALRRSAAAAGVRNGVDVAVGALARLLACG
jgi:hypothetical protein